MDNILLKLRQGVYLGYLRLYKWGLANTLSFLLFADKCLVTYTFDISNIIFSILELSRDQISNLCNLARLDGFVDTEVAKLYYSKKVLPP